MQRGSSKLWGLCSLHQDFSRVGWMLTLPHQLMVTPLWAPYGASWFWHSSAGRKRTDETCEEGTFFFFFSPKGEKQMICNSKQLHLCYLRKEKYTLAHGSGKQLRKRANITHYSQFLGCISWLHSFTSLGAVSLEAVLALRFVLMLSRTRTKQHIIKPTLKEQVTESCPWHSQLARGKVILPCEIILTSIK